MRWQIYQSVLNQGYGYEFLQCHRIGVDVEQEVFSAGALKIRQPDSSI
jgi:hypothetical protein